MTSAPSLRRSPAARSGGRPGTVRSTNPARLDEVVAEVALGDAGTAVAAAARRRETAQRAWADVPAPVRGRAIAHIGRLVEDNAEALAALVTREIGKPYAEALGEVQEIVDTCDFFLGEGRRLYGQTVPSEMPDKQLFTFRNPVGAVAVITAGNFPVAVPSWYIVPALLCGNTVVWKPAEYSAAVGAGVLRAVRAAAAGCRTACSTSCYADGPATFAGLEQALDAAADRQGRASPGRPRSARGSASSPGGTCSRPAWSSAARTRWWSPPTPTSTWPSRGRCSPASAPPGSGARRSAR